jgi:hypothetical protein
VAVNPDRELARVAREREWEVRQFRNGVPLRERVNMPPRRAAVASVASLVVVAAAGGAGWWLWRRRRASVDQTPPASVVTATFDQLRQAAPDWVQAAQTAVWEVRRPAASSPRKRPGRRRR